MEKKDYSLLRPFDLEAAKRGEVICWHSDGEVLKDVTITKRGSVCGLWKDSADRGECIWSNEKAAEKFRMAPLAWVEGKPVYKGDVPWFVHATTMVAHKVTITGFNEQEGFFDTVEFGPRSISKGMLTWTPPKVKREGWVNVYQDFQCGTTIHATRNIADREASPSRLACIHIEWDEPAGQEGGAA